MIDFKADLKNVLVDWLDRWDHGKAKASDKITVQTDQGLVETVPETDENNSLYNNTFHGCLDNIGVSVLKHRRIRLSSSFPVCA